ncbi:MAG: T9SS type A sorting domain-containing protein [Chlorobi bacterium]|nr:T9SS type A sorting domain-containing protein [Chlorobiota bacterium]
MKKLYLPIILLFTISQISLGQTLLLEENFDYTVGTNLTANGWAGFSSTGNRPIQVTSGSLSFPSYPSSGISNSTTIIGTSTSGEDIKQIITEQNSGSIYISFLVNFSAATTAVDGDYFIGYLTSTGTTIKGRIFVKRSGSNIAFGVSKGSTTPNLTDYIYLLNTTYLIVLKYTFNTLSSDDVISLFVNPSLSGTEPSPTLTNLDISTDLANIGAVALRQGSKAYTAQIDGIRVSDAWSLAPLPVELTSFTATTITKGTMLNWSTATEVNNYGFEVERKSSFTLQNESGDSFYKWEKIGFVEGHGNSNSPNDYSFFDNSSVVGEVSYRLKQIDTDGGFEYSDVVTVTSNKLAKYELHQNYPNPFNPSTLINYSLAKDSRVSIIIYNVLGQKVTELVNKKQSAGNYEIKFDASNLTSGLYFYRLETPNYSKTMKMILLR